MNRGKNTRRRWSKQQRKKRKRRSRRTHTEPEPREQAYEMQTAKVKRSWEEYQKARCERTDKKELYYIRHGPMDDDFFLLLLLLLLRIILLFECTERRIIYDFFFILFAVCWASLFYLDLFLVQWQQQQQQPLIVYALLTHAWTMILFAFASQY